MEFTLNRRSFLQGAAALAGAAAFGGLTLDAQAATPGSRIVIGRPTDADNLDPVTCIGNQNIFLFNLILDGLVKTSDDGESIEPCLATEWEVSEDGTTYTFHVQEGLVFSNGDPVTKDDWQWTFDRAMQTTDSNWHECVANIDKVECPDDTTVIVTTKVAAASTLANLCIFTLGVQSKAYFDEVGEEKYVDGPIGVGPFVIKEWKKGEYLTMQANPHYRLEGLPLTEEIEFKVVADDAARAIQLQGGDIDATTDLPFSTMMQLESDPNVTPEADPSTMVYWISLNVENEYLANEKVREALFKATDAQQFVDALSYGFATAAGSVLNPTSEYCDLSLQPPAADVEAAKALLAEAGYPDGFSVRMLLRGGNATYEQIAMVLQQQWAAVGVNIELDQREATAYSEARKAMDLDIIISGWSDDVQDPTQLMQFIFDFSVNSGYYTNFHQPEDMVALNEQATVEIDVEKRKELYAQIQQGFASEGIFIPLLNTPWNNALRNDVTGWIQTPLGNFRFDELAKA